MEEIKLLAKTLMQCKPFKARQQRLEESLDTLSLEYPELYSQLFREMKKRELAFNDPHKIAKWLSTSNSGVFVKLHEALILVKGQNIMAKEEYINNLKQMLCQTIENGTNIDIAIKICNLIEKSPHLRTIYERLMYYIQQVKQLNFHNHNTHEENEKNTWTGHINPITIVDAFGQLNIQGVPYVQPQQHSPVWPPLVQPTNLKSAQPHFSLNCFGYNHLEMMATADKCSTSNFSQRFANETIINQEMNEAIYKWLHYLKLHKYQWFFNALSYLEIESIDEDNIEGFITKVNRNSITKGAQRKICLSVEALRNRPQKLKEIILALDLEVATDKLHEFIIQLKEMLYYPIPNKYCGVVGEQLLQRDIVLVMEKTLFQLLRKLDACDSFTNLILLRPSLNKYLECALLITKNQIFTKEHYDKTIIFDETLKFNVQKKQKKFTHSYSF